MVVNPPLHKRGCLRMSFQSRHSSHDFTIAGFQPIAHEQSSQIYYHEKHWISNLSNSRLARSFSLSLFKRLILFFIITKSR